MLKLAILDLDGFLIDPTTPSFIQRNMIKGLLRYSMGEKESEEYIVGAERYTLKNPMKHPRLYNGQITAFTEDPYLWRFSQMDCLWEHLKVPVEKNLDIHNIDSLFDYAFKESAEDRDEDIKLMKNAKLFVDTLMRRKIHCAIVTNSSTTRAEITVNKLGAEIEVYGDAKKFVVERETPSYEIDGEVVYSHRPYYFQALRTLMKKYNVKPSGVTALGDVTTLDLLPPLSLGMKCVLKINKLGDGFKTPRVFIDFAIGKGITVVNDLIEAAKLFG